MTTRAPYNGTSRKLVLAFDIGTTYSGVCYSILDPSHTPEISTVTRFPAQERVGGDSKIPTIIYYDQEGEVCAVGAEATIEGIEQTAEDEGWTKAEWFKLHMRPDVTSNAALADAHHLPPLPQNKSVIDVFSDLMRYLYNCTKTYIQETHASYNDLWASVKQRIDYVLTHPNGWEGTQQEQLRKAAIAAGLVPDTEEGRSRVRFVTEGEASLHFCIQNGLAANMKDGDGVLIVDAGGGTVDLSAYSRTSEKRTSFIEIAPSECHFQGSIFVTNRAREFFHVLLRDTKFVDDIENITNRFDKTTKLTFRGITDPQFIKFGSARDRDPMLNIRSGQLKLQGHDVAAFFDPSVACIVQAVLRQRRSATKPISSVFLVGGFAASDWLYSQLKDSLEPFGLRLCRPNSRVNKAVADGAVSFYLDHFVSARVSKVVYGVDCNDAFDPSNSEHKERLSSVFISMAGEKRVRGAFDIVLQKGIQVSEAKEFRRSYHSYASDRAELAHTIVALKCYRGTSTNPRWTNDDTDMYSTLCFIEADTSQMCRTLKPRRSSGAGRLYYTIEYDVILLFGLTELKAQIAWKEQEQEKRCVFLFCEGNATTIQELCDDCI